MDAHRDALEAGHGAGGFALVEQTPQSAAAASRLLPRAWSSGGEGGLNFVGGSRAVGGCFLLRGWKGAGM
jgi:hypothetical protein